MKQWHGLLKHIDCYSYDQENEEIVVKHSPRAINALAVYQKILKDYSLDKNDALKWSFDIALNCVREMTEEDRERYKHNLEIDFWGLGLFIRNNYIRPSKRYRGRFEADNQCTVILELMRTILHISYNCFSEDIELPTLSNFVQDKILDMHVAELDFCPSICEKLLSNGIDSVENIIVHTEAEMLEILQNKEKFEMVKSKLDVMGLALAEEDSPLAFENDKSNVQLQEQLAFNYTHSNGILTEKQINIEFYNKWDSHIKELYNLCIELYSENWNTYEELAKYATKLSVWTTLKSILVDMVGKVNGAYLTANRDVLKLFVAYCRNRRDEYKINKLDEYQRFKLRCECYLARKIIEQKQKSLQMLADDQEDIRILRRLKTSRRRKHESSHNINHSVGVAESKENMKHSIAPLMVKICRSEILYIHKKQIRCQKENHDIISATATLTGLNHETITLNVNYCKDCDLFFMNYTTYEMYKEKYGVLLGNLRMESTLNKPYNSHILSDESPLKLCGYSVSQKDGYSAQTREYIIAQIIDKKIMRKSEVIKYLEYFISMNGKKRGNEIALAKWKSDLKFASGYHSEKQPRHRIESIEKYR